MIADDDIIMNDKIPPPVKFANLRAEAMGFITDWRDDEVYDTATADWRSELNRGAQIIQAQAAEIERQYDLLENAHAAHVDAIINGTGRGMTPDRIAELRGQARKGVIYFEDAHTMLDEIERLHSIQKRTQEDLRKVHLYVMPDGSVQGTGAVED